MQHVHRHLVGIIAGLLLDSSRLDRFVPSVTTFFHPAANHVTIFGVDLGGESFSFQTKAVTRSRDDKYIFGKRIWVGEERRNPGVCPISCTWNITVIKEARDGQRHKATSVVGRFPRACIDGLVCRWVVGQDRVDGVSREQSTQCKRQISTGAEAGDSNTRRVKFRWPFGTWSALVLYQKEVSEADGRKLQGESTNYSSRAGW